MYPYAISRHVGGYLIALARIAVPTFYMITGFFYSTNISKNKNYILKIVQLIFRASSFFIFFNLIVCGIDGTGLQFIKSCFRPRAIIDFILLNSVPYQGHLWYLFSLLYSLIAIDFVEKQVGREKLYPLIPVLLLGDLILGKYSLLLFGIELPYVYVRNWVFVGVPYILLGNFICSFSEKHKYNSGILKGCIALFCLMNILEREILVRNGVNAARDHYFCTTILSSSIFLLCINRGAGKNCLIRILAVWGRKYSTRIYIVHPAIITILKVIHFENIMEQIGAKAVYNCVAPFLVFFFTLAITMCCDCFQKMSKQAKEKP